MTIFWTMGSAIFVETPVCGGEFGSFSLLFELLYFYLEGGRLCHDLGEFVVPLCKLLRQSIDIGR